MSCNASASSSAEDVPEEDSIDSTSFWVRAQSCGTCVHGQLSEGGCRPPTPLQVGVALSIVADALIAISLNLQKFAHNRNVGSDGRAVKHYTRREPFALLPCGR